MQSFSQFGGVESTRRQTVNATLYSIDEIVGASNDELRNALESNGYVYPSDRNLAVLKCAKLLAIRGGLEHEDALLLNNSLFNELMVTDDDELVARFNRIYPGLNPNMRDITRMGLIYLLAGVTSPKTRRLIAVNDGFSEAFRRSNAFHIEEGNGVIIKHYGRGSDANGRHGEMIAIEEAYYTEHAHMVYPLVQEVQKVKRDTIQVRLPDEVVPVSFVIYNTPEEDREQKLNEIRTRVLEIDQLLMINGVYHNSLIPDNVLLDQDSDIWIKDFSLASRTQDLRLVGAVIDSWGLDNILWKYKLENSV